MSKTTHRNTRRKQDYASKDTQKKRKESKKSARFVPYHIPKLPCPSKSIEVIPCGRSAGGVTGSCTLVRTPDVQFLLECGLYQESGHVVRQYRENSADFPFDPKEIDFVLVGHCHGDHILRIPLLFKRGFKGKVFMPEGSLAVAKILFYDCVEIAARDAKEITRKLGAKVDPLYTKEDVQETVKHIVEIPFDQWTGVNENVEMRFVPSGHILNAAQIEINVSNRGVCKKIVYTSDLGNTHIRKQYVTPFRPIAEADLLIGETTYANESQIATQETRDRDIEKLRQIVEDVCVNKRKKLLIPAFANARSQEILTCLYDAFGNDPNFSIPVIYDSPLGNHVCKAYLDTLEGDAYRKFSKVLHWTHVRFMENSFESEAWRQDDCAAIIIASSGMLDFGRSNLYARMLVNQSDSCILFCGYTVQNSLASKIRETKKRQDETGVLDEEHPVLCDVDFLSSFSSHMQDDDLLKYYSQMKCDTVLLCHGEPEQQEPFKERLQKAKERLGSSCRILLAQQYEILAL